MSHAEYNGWHNYETWAVNLWLDNDQGTQNYWLEAAAESLANAKPCLSSSQTAEQMATYDLSQRLKDEMEERIPTEGIDGTVWGDLLGAALSEVDWREIAEHMVRNAKEHAEYEAKKQAP